MKKVVSCVLSLLMGMSFVACQAKTNQSTASNGGKGKEIVLATTTSTRDSGLLDELLPIYEKKSGNKVKVLALGTGAAIAEAQKGNADVLLVHDRKKEDAFIQEGYGLKRVDLMYNDFLVCADETVQGKFNGETDVLKIMKTVKDQQIPFVSRGDESGTHSFEKKLWAKAGSEVPDKESFYFSLGQGMSATLNVTGEKKGVTITDRATFLATRENTKLVEISQPSKDLVNQYGIIELNPEKVPLNNAAGGKDLMEFFLSKEAQDKINTFGKAKYGQALFVTGSYK